MRRRALVVLSVSSWIATAGCDRAVEPRRVGVLLLTASHDEARRSFERALTERSDREIVFFVRNAEGRLDRLDGLADELIAERLDLLAAFTTPAAMAAKRASARTKTPVVFGLVSDPVGAGLVSSLPRPGGHVTGTVDSGAVGAGKRLEHLVKAFPQVRRVLVVRIDAPRFHAELDELERAAAKLGVTLVVRSVASDVEAREALLQVGPDTIDGIYVPSDSIAANATEELAALVRRHRVPAIRGGGADPVSVMSFGIDIADAGAQTGVLAAKVLNGLPPADLPVEPPLRVLLTLFPQRAENVGVAFSEEYLSLADEVRFDRE